MHGRIPYKDTLCTGRAYMTYFEKNVSTSTLSTLRAGGPARLYVPVTHTSELPNILRTLQNQNISFLVLGGGSNILFSDKGYDGCIIHMKTMDVRILSDDGDHVQVIADAGVLWDTFVEEMVSKDVWGLENLSGIPGTVGAAPVQNVGAYGVEVKDVIAYVDTYDVRTQTTRRFSNTECAFGYRDSMFKQNCGRYVITAVAFDLTKNPRLKLGYKDVAEYFKSNSSPTIHEIRTAILSIRARKFPDLTRVGTAGSFFKNPVLSSEEARPLTLQYPDIPLYPTPDGKVKISLAWLLDKALNLKGYRKGNVALFEHQPLVLVAHEGASAVEIDAFAQHVEDIVRDATGISIEREVVTL